MTPSPQEFWILYEDLKKQRIDQFLKEHDAIVSRSMAQRLIKSGMVEVNGAATECSYKLRTGDEIYVLVPPPDALEVTPEEGPLDVVYEDDDLLVVNKPAGLVVHPAPGHPKGTLVNFLMYHFQKLSQFGGLIRPGLVHRIDKDTSGLLVIAKHEKIHEKLAQQFQEHSIHRLYHAIVWGNPMPSQGTIEGNIGRHPRHRQKMTIVGEEEGKEAVTHWKILKRFDGVSLVQCQLETGRTHQIRVHMTSKNWPLVGDPQYGRIPRDSRKSLPSDVFEQCAQFSRQALHAKELGFEHPGTKEFLKFECEYPEDFQQLLTFINN